MKVALLLFGQPRFLNDSRVVESFNYLKSKFALDVFCHTWWSEEENTYTCSDWTNIKKCPVNEKTIEIIKNIYKPKKLKWEPSRTFKTNSEIHKFILNKFPNHSLWTEKHANNIQSQLCSIQSVSRLFEKYKQDYDFVILDRFDTYLKIEEDISQLPRDAFYLSNIHQRFPDMIFMYGTKFLDWSSNVYDDFSDPDVYQNVWEPICEPFKFYCFYKRFSLKQAFQINIDSIAVRQ